MATATLFPLGQLLITPGALEALGESGELPTKFLQRHTRCDWGDLCDQDKQANDAALEEGTRIFSAYHTGVGEKVWVITECDRSATTILLPAEY